MWNVNYLIPYNGPPLKNFDPKVSFIRPLGPLLGEKKFRPPNAARFGDMGGKVWTLTPFFSKSGRQFSPNFNTMYHLVISIDGENFMQDPW